MRFVASDPRCWMKGGCAAVVWGLSAAVALLGSGGCGGRAAPEAEDDEPRELPPAPRAEPPAPAEGPGAARRPGSGLDFGEVVLPDCVPGFRARSFDDARCRYLHDGLCYEDETAVCACACPGELCVFVGFQRVEGPVNVVCQARP